VAMITRCYQRPLALVAVEVGSERGERSAFAHDSAAGVPGRARGGWVIQSSRVTGLPYHWPGGLYLRRCHRSLSRASPFETDDGSGADRGEHHVQTTRYRHYPDFRETLSRAVQAAASVLARTDCPRRDALHRRDPSPWYRRRRHVRLGGVGRHFIGAPKLGPMAQAGFPVGTWEGQPST